MIRKIVTVCVLVPLAVLIVVFAVANRQMVVVSLDPFGSLDPAYAVRMPLFILIFVLLIFGVLTGGIAAWLRQSKWRRHARQLDRDARALRAENDALRRQAAAVPSAVPSSFDPPPPIHLRAPAA